MSDVCIWRFCTLKQLCSHEQWWIFSNFCLGLMDFQEEILWKMANFRNFLSRKNLCQGGANPCKIFTSLLKYWSKWFSTNVDLLVIQNHRFLTLVKGDWENAGLLNIYFHCFESNFITQSVSGAGALIDLIYRSWTVD